MLGPPDSFLCSPATSLLLRCTETRYTQADCMATKKSIFLCISFLYIVPMTTKKKPTRPNKTAVLLWVPDALHAWVKEQAEQIGVSTSGLYRILVAESKKRRIANAK